MERRQAKWAGRLFAVLLIGYSSLVASLGLISPRTLLQSVPEGGAAVFTALAVSFFIVSVPAARRATEAFPRPLQGVAFAAVGGFLLPAFAWSVEAWNLHWLAAWALALVLSVAGQWAGLRVGEKLTGNGGE